MKLEDVEKSETDTLLIQLKKDIAAADLKPPSPSRPPVLFFSKRFTVAVLLFFGNATIQMDNLVTNIIVTEMRSKNQTSLTTLSDTSSNSLVTFLLESPLLQWDAMTVSLILNMIWYGALFSPIGGIIAHKFGGVVTMGVSMLLASIIVLISPFSLRMHFYLFLAVRGLTGVLLGFAVASCTQIFAHWIPTGERSTFIPHIMNGFYFGNALTYILCGFLARHWGWSMAFYGAGMLCFVWSLLWLFLVTNDPVEDKTISEEELTYIKKETGNISAAMNSDRPFKSILSSAPFWALTLCRFSYGWGLTFAVSYCPLYIKDATNKNMSIVGYISSIPNIGNVVAAPLLGILLSNVQKRTKLGDNLIHKTLLSIGFVICSALFAFITLANSLIASMTCLTIINILISYNRVIYELITVNMAPNHTSLVTGLSLFGHNIGSIVSQMFIGCMVPNHNLQEWNMCFLWSSAVFLFIASIYLIFGSSKTQSWSVLQTSHGTIQESKLSSLPKSENNEQLLK